MGYSLFVLAAFLLISCGAVTYRPTVLWHGMGDTCCYPFSMGKIKELIEKNLPGIYVYSIEVGESIEADEINSYLMNVNDQIDFVCKKLKADTNLTHGFNAMGFSQGGQFLRAYIERCNDPPVYNYLSVGGQHQGIFGFPKCLGNNTALCETVRKLLDLGAYTDEVQPHLVQAEYWQDPLNEEEYLAKSVFLPDINNNLETKNATYKKNFMSVNEVVLVKFTEDTVVIPRESEWFGFFVAGQDRLVADVKNTTLYQEDWIGLKYLMDNDKVEFIPCTGDHLQFTDEWFESTLVPYLNNTL